MTIQTGAPKVILTETDLTTSVASTGGAYCAMVIPAPRGPVDAPVLITNEPQLINVFTPQGTIAPSYDTSFYVALRILAQSNKLWIMRAAEQPMLGGGFVRVAGAVTAGAPNAAAPAEHGFPNVDHYDLTSVDGRINPGPIVFTADSTPGNLTVADAFYQAIATGDVVQLSVTGGVLPLPLAGAQNYYVIKDAQTDKISLAATALDASQGNEVTITSAGSGTLTVTCSAKSINSVFTVDLASDTLTLTSGMYDLVVTGDSGTVAVNGSGVLPTPLTSGGAAAANLTTTAATYTGVTLKVPTAGLIAGMTVTGAGIASNTTVAAIVDASTLTLSKAVAAGGVATSATLTFTTSAATTAATTASTTISVPTANLTAGMTISGGGLSTGITIASITNGTTLVASSAVTVASGVTLSFSSQVATTAATNPLLLSVPTTNLVVGQGVSGTGIPNGATIASIPNGTTLTLSAAVTATILSGASVNFSADPTVYYIYKTPIVNKIKLCTTLQNAQNGVGLDLTDTGSGTLELTFASITATTPGQDKAILFYGADPGNYNNNLSFTLTNYTTNPSLVKEPGAFLVQFYYNGVVLAGEQWVCSFDPTHKDGRGQSIYIVDVLAASNYVRAIVNPLLDATSAIADVLTQVQFAGGSDGLQVTDSTMITALNTMQVPDKYLINFLCDSGWTTQAYQLACIQFAESRGSAAAFISTPYSAEITENAVLDCISYYQNLGSQSSHAGMFTSHLLVADQYNNRQIWISPVGDVVADYSTTFANLLPGQPVGGSYGPIRNALDVANHWTDGEMDMLYDNNVNPIRFKLGQGIQIWGQKTLQSRPSDLDRLNARMVLMAIEPALTAAYEALLFSANSVQNDVGARRQITLITDNYMATVKARGGVYAWLTVCDDTNNTLTDVANETINVWLFVQIVKAVEYIPFTVAVTPTDMSFSIAEALLAPGSVQGSIFGH